MSWRLLGDFICIHLHTSCGGMEVAAVPPWRILGILGHRQLAFQLFDSRKFFQASAMSKMLMSYANEVAEPSPGRARVLWWGRLDDGWAAVGGQPHCHWGVPARGHDDAGGIYYHRVIAPVRRPDHL